MKKESNTIINEAQATTINGNQEYSLAFTFIFINPPTYYKHDFIFDFATIKFLDWIFIEILQEYPNLCKIDFRMNSYEF